MKQVSLAGILIFLLTLPLSAQERPFSAWDATAFCSYQRYHPFSYIKADNNWEILLALRTPRTQKELNSLGIENTRSQLMLLQIEGLLLKNENGTWKTLMPLLDSLQTVEARTYSKQIAQDIYQQTTGEFSELKACLQQEKLQDHAYTLFFSYVLDGKIWDSFNDFSELNASATWDGACWALYFPRKFSCGTNTYDNEFVLCWTEKQPDFIWKELNSRNFITPFLTEYNQSGRITSAELLDKSLKMGLVNKDGTLRTPVIDSKDSTSRINLAADRIIAKIAHYFSESDIIDVFQKKFGLEPEERKLACTMLYHEVMWDLMDLLTEKQVIIPPAVWKDKEQKSTYSVVFLLK